jgi:hypothetical protein
MTITSHDEKTIFAIAMFHGLGIDTPLRRQVALQSRYGNKMAGFEKRLSKLKKEGLVA